MAEHVSPPLSEEIKVTLKVSQNLHASMTPSIVGALVTPPHKGNGSEQAGFDKRERSSDHGWIGFGWRLAGRRSGRRAVGIFHAGIYGFVSHVLVDASGLQNFSTMLCRSLARWNTLEYSSQILLAAGFVHAKTGTFSAQNALTKTLMVTGKGLAGYMTTAGLASISRSRFMRIT